MRKKHLNLTFNQIWENQVVDGLTCKLRDNFVQWQYVTGKGERVTFGFRIKDVSLAQEVSTLKEKYELFI